MREIVDEVAGLGNDAIQRFTCVLDVESAAEWAAYHLVEKVEIDPPTLEKCFACVEKAKARAEAENRKADAMGISMWLKDWKKRKNR